MDSFDYIAISDLEQYISLFVGYYLTTKAFQILASQPRPVTLSDDIHDGSVTWLLSISY